MDVLIILILIIILQCLYIMLYALNVYNYVSIIPQ